MLTQAQKDNLIKPMLSLIDETTIERDKLNVQLTNWFDGEIDAGRATLSSGFVNSDHTEKLNELESIYQAAFQYKEFLIVLFRKDTSLEFDPVQTVVLEYYAGLETALQEFRQKYAP